MSRPGYGPEGFKVGDRVMYNEHLGIIKSGREVVDGTWYWNVEIDFNTAGVAMFSFTSCDLVLEEIQIEELL